MAKTKISEFNANPALNTDIDSINIAEGCAPSGINDAIRELMAQLKDFQTGAVGDSFNGPIGTSTAAAGAFTTLSATGSITSTLATGTAPLVIASTTKVANLNVDLLDGSDWASPAALGSTTPAAVSATTLSASAAVTLSGGTANGVTYLNGSKVLTSGSALTFDGSALLTTGRIDIQNANALQRFLNGSGTRTGYFQVRSDAFEIWSDQSAIPMVFGVSNAEGMRLTSTGLGIGTSSPAKQLDLAANNTGITTGDPLNTLRFTDTDTTSAAGQPMGRIEWYSSDADTAGVKAYIQTQSTDGSPDADMVFATNHVSGGGTAEKMRIQYDGNVGIGTSSPISKLTVLGAGTINAPETTTTGGSIQTASYGITTRTGNLELGATDSLAANIGGSLSFSARYTGTNATWVTGKIGAYRETATSGVASSYLAFATTTGAGDLTERARIDSSGNLLVGTTSNILSSRLDVYTSTLGTNAAFRMDRNANVDNVAFYHQYAQSTNSAAQCRFYNSSFVSVGTITSSGSATAYNTSSDYRLKEDIQPMTGALAKVAALKPCTYKWKVDGSDGQGFIAHELAEVVPDAVVGDKDAVDAEGKPVYQGIDTSFLVATLTAALQEQQAIIESLKARLDAANL